MSDSAPISSRRITLLVAAAVVLGPLSMLIYLPVLPDVQSEFGASKERTQLTFSMYIFATGISQLFLGSLSDRVGRRPIVVAGSLFFVIGSVLAALATSVEMLVAARMIQAAGGGAGLVVSRAILADLFEPTEMARRFAIVVLLMMIGPTMGPILGAEIAAAWSWRGIFWVLSIIGALVLTVMTIWLPETLPPEKRSPRSLWAGIALALSRRRFVLYVLVAATSLSGYFLFISIAPLMMSDMFSISAQQFGRYFLVLSASYALGNVAATKFGPQFGIRKTILVGSAVGLAGALALVVLAIALPPHPLALWLPMALVTFSNGLSMPSIQAGAVAQVPERSGAASSSISFLMQMAGASVIQLVAIAPTDTATVMAGTEALLAFMLFGLALYLFRTRGQTGAA